jgi:hypothetical protein
MTINSFFSGMLTVKQHGLNENVWMVEKKGFFCATELLD